MNPNYSELEQYKDKCFELDNYDLVDAFSYKASDKTMITDPLFDCVATIINSDKLCLLVHSNLKEYKEGLREALSQVECPTGAVIIGGDPRLMVRNVFELLKNKIPLNGIYTDFWFTGTDGDIWGKRKEIIVYPEKSLVELITKDETKTYYLS